jgi:hypothetical protein
VKRTAVEDPVDRTDDRPPVRRRRRQSQQPHPVETLGNLCCRQSAFGAVNAQQVPAGVGIAAVQDLL